MILKKPYGFLIKHFKIINLLILVPMLYIALKFGDIAGFFRDYVAAKYNTPETIIAGKYITVLTYIVLIFLIGYNLFIFILMKDKKKPTKEYALSAIYYTVLLLMTLVFYSSMTNIEIGKIEASGINMIRDFANLCPLPSYVIMILTLFKGIGFNIKTFNFDNNLDLQVTEDDEAEFELKVGPDSYVIKRNIVHNLRELKYYILENKFVFSCIGIVLGIIIVVTIYMNFGVYNRHYRLNQSFALDSFTLSLQDSYITDVDYSGNIINKGKYYLVIKIGIQNRGSEDVSIDKSNFRVYSGKNVFFPSYDRSNRFLDIGNAYQGNNIKAGTQDNYVLVYELEQEDIKNSYEMKILSNLEVDANVLTPSYKIINITPQNITRKEELGKTTINKELTLKNTTLGNTRLTLKSTKLVSSYSYLNSGRDTSNNTLVPHQGKMLLVIKDKIKYDKETSYYKNTYRKFYEDFATIEFDYENYNGSKKMSTNLIDVTPSGVTSEKVYEVSSLIKYGENLKMILTIRNKQIEIALS